MIEKQVTFEGVLREEENEQNGFAWHGLCHGGFHRQGRSRAVVGYRHQAGRKSAWVNHHRYGSCDECIGSDYRHRVTQDNTAEADSGSGKCLQFNPKSATYWIEQDFQVPVSASTARTIALKMKDDFGATIMTITPT